ARLPGRPAADARRQKRRPAPVRTGSGPSVRAGRAACLHGDAAYLPTWSPMMPPSAAPPTVPRMPPLLITAPATPPMAAPPTVLFWRRFMLSQDEQPATEAASTTAVQIFEKVPIFIMMRLLFLCPGSALTTRQATTGTTASPHIL